MDSYRPQSPDLSSYAPQSPDLSGYQPQSPDLPGVFPVQQYNHQYSRSREYMKTEFDNNTFGYGGYSRPATSQPQYVQQSNDGMAPSRRIKDEGGDEYLPDAPAKRNRKSHQSLPHLSSNNLPYGGMKSEGQPQDSKPQIDATLGVQLKTSFPVARIKRIMQADEDIGKVAQVTPHVVSRALELFMIRLIAASADQARGATAGGAGAGKGPRRILAQHMKKAIKADDNFDFLADIVDKVPDAPSKTKKEAGSDSEDGSSTVARTAKKKGKKRKSENGDD